MRCGRPRRPSFISHYSPTPCAAASSMAVAKRSTSSRVVKMFGLTAARKARRFMKTSKTPILMFDAKYALEIYPCTGGNHATYSSRSHNELTVTATGALAEWACEQRARGRAGPDVGKVAFQKLVERVFFVLDLRLVRVLVDVRREEDELDAVSMKGLDERLHLVRALHDVLAVVRSLNDRTGSLQRLL